jgi:hypothetical protein
MIFVKVACGTIGIKTNVTTRWIAAGTTQVIKVVAFPVIKVIFSIIIVILLVYIVVFLRDL